ncbi:centrosomal protein of 83 kDa-like [Diadema setosum]|uniref:centrosomal protein of 83 kDa-like n=1 Tax=Diadema setosum TaxID=31175 RepID=UPI003B3A0417
MQQEQDGLKAKCEVLQKDAIAEKEKEVARKMQAVREEEWERVNRLEGEKLDLESLLQEFELLKIDKETRHYAEKEAGEERIREAEKRHEETQRELQTIRAKTEHQTSLGKDLEQEQTMNTQLAEKCTRLKAELRDSRAAEQDLMAENDKLKETLEMLQNELVLVKAGMEREAERGEEKLTQHKMTWMDEKTQLERRLDELERKMKQAQKHREEAIQAHAKKKKKYQKVVNRLQDKNQLLEAKNEQLELEKQALRNQIPKETYTKAVRRLRELQRRHAEFRNLMTSANLSQVPIGGMSFAAASVSQPLDASSPIKSTQVHHDDLTAIRHRLDELSENQKLQMDALLGGGVGSVPMTARSEMEKEAEERPLSPDGSGMDMLDL